MSETRVNTQLIYHTSYSVLTITTLCQVSGSAAFAGKQEHSHCGKSNSEKARYWQGVESRKAPLRRYLAERGKLERDQCEEEVVYTRTRTVGQSKEYSGRSDSGI